MYYKKTYNKRHLKMYKERIKMYIESHYEKLQSFFRVFVVCFVCVVKNLFLFSALSCEHESKPLEKGKRDDQEDLLRTQSEPDPKHQ